jgi:hypothetical protein
VKALAILAVCSSLLHFLLWRREVARHAETKRHLELQQLWLAHICRPYRQGQAKITLH